MKRASGQQTPISRTDSVLPVACPLRLVVLIARRCRGRTAEPPSFVFKCVDVISDATEPVHSVGAVGIGLEKRLSLCVLIIFTMPEVEALDCGRASEAAKRPFSSVW